MTLHHKDTRENIRYQLKKDLSSYLFSLKERNPIMCMGIDVSRNGIGIVSFAKLEPESEVLLILKDIGLKLKVIWINKDPNDDRIFHTGLQTHDVTHNLIKLLNREGLINIDELKPK